MTRQIPVVNQDMDARWLVMNIAGGLAVATVSETLIIPANSLVRSVLAYVRQRPANVTGTCTLIVGDDIEDDGLISSVELVRHVNPIIGNDHEELGFYFAPVLPINPSDVGFRDVKLATDRETDLIHGKLYAAVDTTLTAKLTTVTAVNTTEALVRIWFEVLTLSIN